MAGLSHGRFYEGWSGTCAAIAQAQAEAEAGIAVFVDRYTTAPLDQYTVAAFLMAAGNQSFLAAQSSWTDPGTQWHPEYFDQPLGAPKGPATVSGTTWHREFAHVTLDLDCKNRQLQDHRMEAATSAVPAARACLRVLGHAAARRDDVLGRAGARAGPRRPSRNSRAMPLRVLRGRALRRLDLRRSDC